MNKRRGSSGSKKGTAVGIIICFLAAIAIVGTYTLRDYQEMKKQRLAMADDTDDTESAEEKTESSAQRSEEANNDRLVISTQENETEKAQALETDPEGEENSQLLWPVDGNVLLSYSMDKTVYFSTLDQYKYNPAVIISGAEGDQVISSAPGIVKSIDVTAETGTTVNIDLGNGYELYYGQLKEVPVSVGDYVEAKTVLGYVSQPTKYYSVEGCNVYFEMRKDGQPVNPMDYMGE